MNHLRMLLVILALAFAGCAATGSRAHDGGDISGQEGLIWLGGEIVFVEGPEEGGAFLPAELLKLWLQEEELAAGEIELVSRGVRRRPARGVRRPPLLNARPPTDPGRYWRQQPPDPQLMEQARQLDRQRLIEVQQRYPNSQGYQYHNQEPPPTRQLAEIMLRVYSKYPIPQLEHQGRGRAFFTYWQLHRRYSKAELESAELLRLVLNAHFEPTGSMCGTGYDESGECRYCGTGGRQVSNLILDTRRIPKGKDIARSIAGELVVSSRLVQACRERGIQGAEFRPVAHRGRKGLEPSEWSQLVITSKPLRLTGATVTGNNPFDLDENDEYRCPRGHTAGLRQISELHVQRKSWHGADWCHTEKLFGLRRGELRPEPRVLISQKLRQLLVGMKAKGVEFEVAHVEGPRLTVL